MSKHVIFLNGSVGAGKSSLGRALAERLPAGFIDGDDHSDHSRPWYASIRRTSHSIVDTGFALLDAHPAVVIAYPLNCIGWIFFRRKFSDAGIHPIFVTLRASFGAIVDADRGREFSQEEQERIQTMIAEGYDSRPFSDAFVDTDRGDFGQTLEGLESDVRRLMRL